MAVPEWVALLVPQIPHSDSPETFFASMKFYLAFS